MSALGQKRTYAVQKGMSALPPKADIGGRQVWGGPPPRTSAVQIIYCELKTV